MLPNHAPLMVAERFKVLEALYPGRIDLGIGRAPGHRPDDLAGAAPTAGGSGGRRFPRALQRADAVEDRRLPRRASVPHDTGDARGRAGAARSGCSAPAPTARSLRVASAWASPSRIISPASRLPTRSGCTAAASTASTWLQRAARDPGHRGCLRRHRGGGRVARRHRRLQLCAPDESVTTALWRARTKRRPTATHPRRNRRAGPIGPASSWVARMS